MVPSEIWPAPNLTVTASVVSKSSLSFGRQILGSIILLSFSILQVPMVHLNYRTLQT